MAFYGSYFTFDGVSCRDYDLMIYDFGSSGQDDTVAFGSTGTAVEDRTAHKYSSFFYGIKQDKPLSFNLTFGEDCCMLDKGKKFRRPDVARIASWLTGHNTWRWLEIEQNDMLLVRYKCYISALKLITFDGNPMAFSCTVTCDSPYAYLQEDVFEYEVSGTEEIEIENLSSYHGYYYPRFIIDTTARDNITISNISDPKNADGSYKFELAQVANASLNIASGLPPDKRIVVDNDTQIMTVWIYNDELDQYEHDTSINPYNLFNFNYFGLVQGINTITLKGHFNIQIITAFPVDIGA